jgi:hypothetical protein
LVIGQKNCSKAGENDKLFSDWMNHLKFMQIKLLSFCFLILSYSLVCFAQKPLLKRTTLTTEKITFGVGGSLTILGAPNGSIAVESWKKNEMEITVEIEIEGENEEDLALLSKVNKFLLEDTFNSVKILSVGTHDKDYMRKVAKNFPKRLLNSSWRINYIVKVPMICDVSIDAGRGDIKLTGVEGGIRIKAFETNAILNLVGGSMSAVFGSGTVNVNLATRSWRGRTADIQLASGTMNVKFQQNSNAQISAKILRTGTIENLVGNLIPLDRTKFSDKSVVGKAGNGGALLAFTVGDGNLKIE